MMKQRRQRFQTFWNWIRSRRNKALHKKLAALPDLFAGPGNCRSTLRCWSSVTSSSASQPTYTW